MLRTLIIDDEPGARAEIRWLLSAHSGYVVVAEAATFTRGRTQLGKNDYDLVFLDVQLVGGNGFDLVPHVRQGAKVIFGTAFNEHALRAFEVNALDYLLKPVSTERFAASLARLGESPALTRTVPSRRPVLRADDTVLVHTESGDRFLALADISAIFSNENYSDLQLCSGERVLTRRTMKAWEEILPPAQFMRVHRQAVVNLACIEDHRRDSRETAELRVSGTLEPVPVSRSFLNTLEARLAAR